MVSGLSTERFHYELFTNEPPVELERGGTRFLPARNFFGENFQAILLVDGEEVLKLSAEDESHMSAQASQGVIDAFRQGATATLQAKQVALSGPRTFTFSLMGFASAYGARTVGQTAPPAEASSEQDPITIIAGSLSGNRYGLDSQNLLQQDNPYGEGVFVYVPKVKIAGFDRYFIWFVKEGEAVALNGPTISLTTDARRPLDMGYKFWRNTGLSADSVTKEGLNIVYGR